jgi:hypothetical protein
MNRIGMIAFGGMIKALGERKTSQPQTPSPSRSQKPMFFILPLKAIMLILL